MALADKTQSSAARGEAGPGADGHRAPSTRLREVGSPDVVGPHGRLGLVWAACTVAAVAAGTPWLAGWLALTAALAAAQVARSRTGPPDGPGARPGRGPRRRASSSPMVPVAAAGAAAMTVTAAVSPVALAVAAGSAVVVIVGYALFGASADARSAKDLLLVSGLTVMLGAAAAGPVLLRAHTGLVPVLVLFAYAMAYDASTYLVGSGAASAWEGPAAGVAATGTVTLVVAAVLVPPFRGASPWALGALAALLAPLGPVLGSLFPGERQVRLPALRRLDSLLLLGPLWALATALLLD